MARIKIKDLPKDMKVSKEEMKSIKGGALFINFGDIKGESTDDKHEKWIEIDSFAYPTR
jgi:type VI protein secretion system component Hcp